MDVQSSQSFLGWGPSGGCVVYFWCHGVSVKESMLVVVNSQPIRKQRPLARMWGEQGMGMGSHRQKKISQSSQPASQPGAILIKDKSGREGLCQRACPPRVVCAAASVVHYKTFAHVSMWVFGMQARKPEEQVCAQRSNRVFFCFLCGSFDVMYLQIN